MAAGGPRVAGLFFFFPASTNFQQEQTVTTAQYSGTLTTIAQEHVLCKGPSQSPGGMELGMSFRAKMAENRPPHTTHNSARPPTIHDIHSIH